MLRFILAASDDDSLIAQDGVRLAWMEASSLGSRRTICTYVLGEGAWAER